MTIVPQQGAVAARSARHCGQHGSVSVEVAILLPVFLLLIALATVVGRLTVAANAVTIAAHDAARAASISRDHDTAHEQAVRVASTTLADQGLRCEDLTVTPDTSQFSRPVGTPATVEVTVVCDVAMRDIAFAGLPGSRQVSASFTSPIDTWRGRQ
jgi:Flp pilus assembly protein TadG